LPAPKLVRTSASVCCPITTTARSFTTRRYLKPEDLIDCHVCCDTHVADLPHDKEGRTPTGRSDFASPELQRFKDALDKYSEGDMEIMKVLREYVESRKAEDLKPLLQICVPTFGPDFAALERRVLHQELFRHHSMDMPMVIINVGDHYERDRRSLFDERGFGKSILDEAHMIPKMEAKEAPDFFFDPKKPKGEFVGRHGEMPIPSGKRKKFKPSRNAHKGRRK
jgi:hypothetical protein